MRRATQDGPGVLWTAYNPLGPGGYAEEARSFVLELDRLGLDVGIEPRILSPEHIHLAPAAKARLKTLCARKLPDSVPRVHHVFPHHFHPQGGGAHVVRTMLESSLIPPFWVDSLKGADEVWVPSRFNVETFSRSGVPAHKLRVVHEILPPFYMGKGRGTPPFKKGNKFLFLSVFWEWSLRKGWDTLIRAFVEEFGAGEDAALILKTGPAAGTERMPPKDFVKNFLRKIQAGKGRSVPEIVCLADPLPPGNFPALYRACDCFVLPSRGEGWGRPYMEAMAVGLPVIGTGWGGNTEFMTPENSYLLHAPLKDIPERGWAESYFLTGKWAEPSVRELRALMRGVYESPREARRRAARGQEDILRLCDGKRVATEIRNHLIRLSSRQWQGTLHHPSTPGYVIDLSASPDAPVHIRETLDLEDLAPYLKRQGVKRLFMVGTGRAARQTGEHLLRNGIEILFFLDREEQGVFMARPVRRIREVRKEDLEGADMALLAAYPAIYREARRTLLDRGCRVPIFPWVLFFDVEKN